MSEIVIRRYMDGGHQVTKGVLPPSRKAVKLPIPVEVREMPVPFRVETVEGVMEANAGDFLITGVQGEMYPCKRSSFLATYRFVEEGEEAEDE